MFNLVYHVGDDARRVGLEPGETVVGRSASCGLVIDHPSVSRRQARLVVTGAHCRLVDLESTNGTFLNGEPVTEADLADGDAVVFGDVSVQVEWTAEDRVALSEDHELVESHGTLFRPVEAPGAETSGGPAVDARRLLGIMAAISRLLVRPQPIMAVLDTVVDLAFGSVPAERAFLMLADEATGEVLPRVVRCRDGSMLERATISRTIVRRVMEERVAILARDARVDSRLASAHSIQTSNIRSFMCVPMWSQEAVVGVLYVDNPFTREFSRDDLDLFTALSEYASVAIEQARLAARVLEETKRRERLQRYHSPSVVDRILSEAEDAHLPLAAQERDVSVLFCDVVGFTALSERMEPNDLARLLNRYFARMTDVVFELDGTLDKFIGDAIMAVFGAPLDQPDHAMRAVHAAIGMRRALADLNAQSDIPVEVRIAVNSGLATAGDIGSPRRREYTVLGDVVNTCARVQANVCEPGRIVITRATADRIGGAVPMRSLGSQRLRGRGAEVDLFEIETAF
jgi:adenylate cyclase